MDSEITGDKGTIRISEEVVAIIAGVAATDIEGVAGMSGGIVGGIAEILGRRNLAKGVKVNLADDSAVIDIFVIVQFGVRIPDVAFKIQNQVKKSVEQMTGLKVSEANVHVQGVEVEKDVKEEKEEKEKESE